MNKLKNIFTLFSRVGNIENVLGKRTVKQGNFWVYSFYGEAPKEPTVWSKIEDNAEDIEDIENDIELIKKHLGIRFVQIASEKKVAKIKKSK